VPVTHLKAAVHSRGSVGADGSRMTKGGKRSTTAAQRAWAELTHRRSGPVLLGLAAIGLGLLVWLVPWWTTVPGAPTTGREASSGRATPTF
jgi:hypothetical protein